VQLREIRARFDELPDGFWVVEGAGGLMVPLNEGARSVLIRDLARALRLPLVVVASTRLGTINHTALTLESARNAGLEIAGIVLVGPEDPGLEETLRAMDPAPILARIPELREICPETVSRAAEALGPLALKLLGVSP
jgi:dethiobiotin synthetase